MDANNDTSRISASAHYTGHIWYRNQLSCKELYSTKGRMLYHLISPIAWLSRRLMGADIEAILLQRHRLIDHHIEQEIEQHGVTQIIELACGLSPRGVRFKNKYGNKINYIETDLENITQLKQEMLTDNGICFKQHKILPINILDQAGDQCLESLTQYLDMNQATLVVSEGLVNYFELDVINPVWERINRLLSAMPYGAYITDVYPELVEHPFYSHIKRTQRAVARFSKGGWPLHFNSDLEMQAGFEQRGYAQVKVTNPDNYIDVLGLEKLSISSAVRVVVAES